jgi:hypothetical protein
MAGDQVEGALVGVDRVCHCRYRTEW